MEQRWGRALERGMALLLAAGWARAWAEEKELAWAPNSARGWATASALELAFPWEQTFAPPCSRSQTA